MARDQTLLPEGDVQQFLHGHPAWTRSGNAIERTWTFDTFSEAIDFVTKVAAVAERFDHHPDIDIRYRRVRLSLTTHDAGGLTWRDPEVADECEKLA